MASPDGNGHANGHPAAYAPENRIGGLLDREMPRNIEAEEGLLGSILLDNGVLPAAREVVSAGDFFRDAHQVLFRTACDLADRGVPVDCVTLADELTRADRFREVGGDDTLAGILGRTPHAANAMHYAGIVREHARVRAVIEQAQETIRAAYGRRETADELIARAGDRLAEVGRDAEEPEFVGLKPWPDPPGEAVWTGLAGEIVRLIAPHTESDPMAILGQFLVCFGNAIGRRAHWRVEQTRHHTNLFLCVVGNSSKARKGTSWGHVLWLMERCDDEWARGRILSGLSSGEGLIWQVRDPVFRREKVGGVKALGGGGYQEVESDPGVSDKRALFVESEFGGTLAMMGREGNSLNGVIRQAWDTDHLRSATKNTPAHATGAHVSIVGHVTSEELHRRLTQTDAANGFANRFLWLCARRSQYLPHGGRIHQVDFTDAVNRLRDAVSFAKMEFEDDGVPMVRDHAANALWEEVYPALSEPKPGLLGAVTSRAEAQAMRVAALYALLDCSKWIRRHHLEAGLAFWGYCEQSAAYIFGDALGDDDAEKLLKALRAAGDAGLTMTRIRREVFRGHRTSEQIGEKLALLARGGMAVMETDPATRRPTTTWKAVQDRGGVTEG